MAVSLPILALAATVFVTKTRLCSWREAILAGVVVWALVLVVSTEVLGALRLLTSAAVGVFWLGVLLIAVVWLVRLRASLRLGSSRRARLGAVGLVFLVVLTALVLVLGAAAVLSAPNTWDSMTYHLARVNHWQQNASVDPYPTQTLRQLYLQPGAEYVLLHLQMLSGSDRLAGLVQWASMVGVLVAISLLTRQLGGLRIAAWCAVAFAFSLPIGILESTSTQNDYVVTLWLVCFVLVAVRITRMQSDRRVNWLLALALGATLGLALLTKATAYVIALPVVVWLTFTLVARLRWRGLALLLVAGVTTLALNGAPVARNVAIFGTPLGPADEGGPTLRYLNDALTPGLFVSNVVRDLGINLVATPWVALNVRAANSVADLHNWLGVDIRDPRTTWAGELFKEHSVDDTFNENFASNPVHTVLLLAAIAAVWPLHRRFEQGALVHAGIIVVAFVLFAAILRWQPWHTRLELPWFVLGAPLVGLTIERISARLAIVLAGLLLAGSVPWILNNHARPLIGPQSILLTSRVEQYFIYNPALQAPYVAAVAAIDRRECNQVGFVPRGDDWEYPLWILSSTARRIEHVGVANVSAPFTSSTSSFSPCAIVTVNVDKVDVAFP